MLSHGSRTPTVLIVDDHRLIAQGISLALNAEGVDAHATFERDVDALLTMARRHRPALAIVDLQLRVPNGALSLIEPMIRITPVLVLTGVIDLPTLGRCLEAGAIGVTSKSETFDRMLRRVRSALAGQPANSVREREILLAAACARRDDRVLVTS